MFRQVVHAARWNASPIQQFVYQIVKKYVSLQKMENGSDSKKMRNRASRLLELATRSRFEGRGDFAGLLTNLATEILEHARDIEQRFASEDIKPSGTNFESSKPDAA
jgi:hypothetical protein